MCKANCALAREFDEMILELKRQLASRPSDVPPSTGSLRVSILIFYPHLREGRVSLAATSVPEASVTAPPNDTSAKRGRSPL